jgi:hypothetical protein
MAASTLWTRHWQRRPKPPVTTLYTSRRNQRDAPAVDAWQKIATILTAAHEVNDFVAIVRLNFGLLPFRAREDIKIALDRHSIGGHFKVLNQRRNGETVGDVAKLAVDSNFHGGWARV